MIAVLLIGMWIFCKFTQISGFFGIFVENMFYHGWLKAFCLNPIIIMNTVSRLAIAFSFLVFSLSLSAAPRHGAVRHNVPLDSIILSDPCILADEATNMYYMTGTGGQL